MNDSEEEVSSHDFWRGIAWGILILLAYAGIAMALASIW